jgi:hypothetical protein
MVPDELISLEDLGGPSFALPDHDDHVHIGYSAGSESTTGGAPETISVLKAKQWKRLVQRLGEIDNPNVRSTPSKASTSAEEDHGPKRASEAHQGE